MKKVRINSIAVQLPETLVTNDHPSIQGVRGLDRAWWSFWGVKQRYILDERKNETVFSLARNVCQRAIKASGLRLDQIDLIIANCSSPYLHDKTSPSGYRFAPRVAGELKKTLDLSSAQIMDTEEECKSFLTAMQLAACFIKTGKYKNVLVCSTENVTKILDYLEEPSPVFGDGAAAVVLSETDSDEDLLASHFISDSQYLDMATAGWRFQDQEKNTGNFGIYFTLNQRENHDIQSVAPQSMPKIIKQMFSDSGYTDEDIAFYVFHQPARILVEAWANRMGFLDGRYGSCVESVGCLSSVSMPFVFFKALEQGKVKPGDNVVFASPGVGWSFGAQIWRVGQVNIC